MTRGEDGMASVLPLPSQLPPYAQAMDELQEKSSSEQHRWERHDWSGVVLDAPDMAALARFYAELRG